MEHGLNDALGRQNSQLKASKHERASHGSNFAFSGRNVTAVIRACCKHIHYLLEKLEGSHRTEAVLSFIDEGLVDKLLILLNDRVNMKTILRVQGLVALLALTSFETCCQLAANEGLMIALLHFLRVDNWRLWEGTANLLGDIALSSDGCTSLYKAEAVHILLEATSRALRAAYSGPPLKSSTPCQDPSGEALSGQLKFGQDIPPSMGPPSQKQPNEDVSTRETLDREPRSKKQRLTESASVAAGPGDSDSTKQMLRESGLQGLSKGAAGSVPRFVDEVNESDLVIESALEDTLCALESWIKRLGTARSFLAHKGRVEQTSASKTAPAEHEDRSKEQCDSLEAGLAARDELEPEADEEDEASSDSGSSIDGEEDSGEDAENLELDAWKRTAKALVACLQSLVLGPISPPFESVPEHSLRNYLRELQEAFVSLRAMHGPKEDDQLLRRHLAQLVVRLGMELSSSADNCQEGSARTCPLMQLLSDVPTFLEQYWEKRPLLVRARQAHQPANGAKGHAGLEPVEGVSRTKAMHTGGYDGWMEEGKSQQGINAEEGSFPKLKPKPAIRQEHPPGKKFAEESLHTDGISRQPTECALNRWDPDSEALLKVPELQGAQGVLSGLLPKCVGCPPAPSDECDPKAVIDAMGGGLGGHMIYGQDVSLVRTHLPELACLQADVLTSEPSQIEEHFLPQSNSSQASQATSTNESRVVTAKDCEDALKAGFSIALRGLTYRVKEVAAIADGLATALGQASVGANLYLTPPGEQGLACHYDDHCVFVCQLTGLKKWKVYAPEVVIPRLYAPRHPPNRAAMEGGGQEFVLGPGDVLYIPRGCPHEAQAVKCMEEPGRHSMGLQQPPVLSSDGAALSSSPGLGGNKERDRGNRPMEGHSLHVTFGIEVEAPFEWEGYLHIALQQWVQTYRQGINQREVEVIGKLMHGSCEARRAQSRGLYSETLARMSSCMEMDHWQVLDVCAFLLHLAIHDCGKAYPELRQACLLAANSAVGRQEGAHTKEHLDCERVEAVGGCSEQSALQARSEIVHGKASFCPLDTLNHVVESCCHQSPEKNCRAQFQAEMGKINQVVPLGVVEKGAHFDRAFCKAMSSMDGKIEDTIPFSWMWWLHMYDEGWLRQTLSLVNKLVPSQQPILQQAFNLIKIEFLESRCLDSPYLAMLQKYQRVRRRFATGMLALHDFEHGS